MDIALLLFVDQYNVFCELLAKLYTTIFDRLNFLQLPLSVDLDSLWTDLAVTRMITVIMTVYLVPVDVTIHVNVGRDTTSANVDGVSVSSNIRHNSLLTLKRYRSRYDPTRFIVTKYSTLDLRL